jgi:hypothetical protein
MTELWLPAVPSLRGEQGQSSVELVAFLPIVLLVGLGVLAVLAGRAATGEAGASAQAGAMALIQGADAEQAARAALPGRVRRRARIRVQGRRVTVTVRAAFQLPFAGRALAATASAVAGPEPPP